MQAQPIIHVEFAASDPAATARFYAEVFGWQVLPGAARDALQFQAPGGPGGAFVDAACEATPAADPRGMPPRASQPGAVLLYLDSDDIEATLAAVERHGGATLVPRTAIPHAGWYAVFADPAGTRMALFSTQPPPTRPA
ncbi:MAG TPA: VOC family protein [Ktedonobacterales bacterium]|jgi:hypothetical protein